MEVYKIIKDKFKNTCKIIKIYNQLNTSLQKITINLMWEYEIICEIQLSYGE